MESFNEPDTRHSASHRREYASYDVVGVLDVANGISTPDNYASPSGIAMPRLPTLPNEYGRNTMGVDAIAASLKPIQNVVETTERELPRPTPSPPKTAFMCFSFAKGKQSDVIQVRSITVHLLI